MKTIYVLRGLSTIDYHTIAYFYANSLEQAKVLCEKLYNKFKPGIMLEEARNTIIRNMELAINPDIYVIRRELENDYECDHDYETMVADKDHKKRFKIVHNMDEYLSKNSPDSIEHDYATDDMLDHIGVGDSTCMTEVIAHWMSNLIVLNVGELLCDSVTDGD